MQYEPPDNLTPAECGTLVDNSVDMRDITATLVDLAVKGYLTIEHQDDNPPLGIVGDCYLSSEEAARRLEQSEPPRATNASRYFVPGNPALMMMATLQQVVKNLPLSPALLARTNAMTMEMQNPAIPPEYSAAT